MAAPTPHPAFIDSNLDTRLAIIVSDSDTVSDLKGKIEKEHQLCFPQLGKIKVHGVKVKRKGYYYHLSDSMTVQSAFYGFSNWFLCVDLFTVGINKQNHHSYNLDCGNLLTGYDINQVALVDGVDVASGLCPRSPNLDETQLQLEVNEQFVIGKAFSAYQTSEEIAEKKVLESKRIEGDRLIDNVCEAQSPDANGREDLVIPIVCGQLDREPEVQNTLSRDIEVCSGRKRKNAEYNESLDDKATGKEKRKRKKRTKELVDDYADNGNSICENGVGIYQQEVVVLNTSKNEVCEEESEKISKGINTIANEPCHSPVSEKAKKWNNITEGELYLKENGAFISEFNEESAKQKTISEQSWDSNKCSVKTALDGLSTERLEVCQSGPSSSSGKKKKKKKAKHISSNLSSQVAVAISSPSKDNKGKFSSLTAGIEMTLTRQADVIDNIPVNITQDAAVSSFPRISTTEMHYGNAIPTHSSADVDIRKSNVDNGERIRDAYDKEAVFGIERITNVKDNQTIDVKGKTNQTDGVTKEGMSSQISDKPLPLERCISSGPNEADVIVNEVITSLGLLESKKIDSGNLLNNKKRKHTKICDQHTLHEAVLEDAKGNEHDNSPIELHKSVSGGVPFSQTMSEEVASAFMECKTDQTCGVTETLTPSLINEIPLPSGKCISSERSAVDMTMKEENSKTKNERANPDREKKKKKSKSRSSERLLKSVNENARGNEHYNFSEGPPRSPSEELANAILALTRSGMDDTSMDPVEASKSNGATMMEKKDEKMRKKSKKSNAHDRNGSEALALCNPNMKIPKSVVNHDGKGLGKDALDVQHLTSGKTSVKNNRKVNRLEGKTSLLTKSGRIFKDASSDSSQDEDLVANSNATVSTPENSFSSDHSDNESNANMNLSLNGSNDLEKKRLDGRNIRKTESTSAAESRTLDRILRSSSRYRKAKITATESQLEDTNSQPVDMVPNSQPNL